MGEESWDERESGRRISVDPSISCNNLSTAKAPLDSGFDAPHRAGMTAAYILPSAHGWATIEALLNNTTKSAGKTHEQATVRLWPR
jgi:hypothetical protein